MSDMPPPPPPSTFDMEPPPYRDDPYDDSWYDYVAEDAAFRPPPDTSTLDTLIPDDAVPDDRGLPDIPPAEQDGLQSFAPPEPADKAWNWHDTRIIGVDRGEEMTEGRYEIGGIDVYASHETGDLGASYLPIASFDDRADAEEAFHDLQQQIHDSGLPAHEMTDFFEQQAFAHRQEPANWRSADPAEYAAYERSQLPEEIEPDIPPPDAVDPLLETALELGGVVREVDGGTELTAEQQALADIGLQAEGFDPSTNPPPFYDEQTNTAYWIGVFQPDETDRTNCITSILSLGRDPESDTVVAHLAPCVPGDWEKTHRAAEFLIDIAQDGDIDRCFEAAEGMALATEQRDLWQGERGVPLTPDAADDIAGMTRDTWEVDL